MDPAGQIKFITVGEFKLGIFISRFDFFAFTVSLLAFTQLLTLFNQYLICFLNDLKHMN